jgi:cysteinyl-tRNA synthetase
MSIHLFNTLSSKKEEFVPLLNNKVKMYCCGVTPYSNTHIGHSRTFFSYDLLYRTLIDHNYEVDWARNITDIDDKIIAKSKAENISCEEIVSRYVNEQNDFLKIFDLYKPKHEPKVTDSIANIVQLISNLTEKGFAYASSSGVYFRVRKFSDYGKLSKNKIDDLKVGARVDVDESKEDPLDFALWKFCSTSEVGWDSPWGRGRPGWHVECSAMIHSLFGDSLDIHMGGRDLIFPHHEAEIAQSEASTDKPLANLWLHAGMVTLYGEKMSKSTNHFVSIKEFLDKYPAEVLRLVFLSCSYTQPLDFTFELVNENLKKLSKLYRFVSLIDSYNQIIDSAELKNEYDQSIFGELETLVIRMRENLADDLNSASALAILWGFIRNINHHIALMEKKNKSLNRADRLILTHNWESFKAWLHNSLGILVHKPDDFFAGLRNLNLISEISLQEIDQKLAERNQARSIKDWAKSDSIRDELISQGIQIQDTPSGTKWTIVV